jgi:hypothetical protein
MKLVLALLALALGSALVPGPASARTWVIRPDGTGDAATIMAGMDSASAGDTVMAMCGTYYERAIAVKSGVYLTSETGSPDCVTIDAQQMDRVLYCNGLDSTTYIVGLTLKSGKKLDNFGGGICCDNAKPRIKNCVIRDCSSGYQGGGLYLYHADVRITDCDFTSNTSGTGGGGMYIRYSKAIVTGCEITGNQQQTNGNYGGGVASLHSVSKFTDCIFSANYSIVGFGGAFGSKDTDSASFSGCLFANNIATAGGRGSGGGALEIGMWGTSNACYAELENCTFSGNKKGAVEFYVGTAYFTNCIIAFSQLGYAFSLPGTGAVEPLLTCCDIYGNEDGDWVGAIADQYGINGNICEDPIFCDAAGNNFSLQSDSPCLNADPCGTIGAYGLGCESQALVPSEGGTGGLRVHPATPSPFGRSTRIDFSLPAAGRVRVEIFDIKGELVATPLDRQLNAGDAAVTWDGVDSRSQQVRSGVYFARITAGAERATVRMLLLR